ncbi:hypothetical protein M0Q50_06010 [bacterium]|jgi:hypothetical protein|nr:hypothetical protein [bacterium]
MKTLQLLNNQILHYSDDHLSPKIQENVHHSIWKIEEFINDVNHAIKNPKDYEGFAQLGGMTVKGWINDRKKLIQKELNHLIKLGVKGNVK